MLANYSDETNKSLEDKETKTKKQGGLRWSLPCCHGYTNEFYL